MIHQSPREIMLRCDTEKCPEVDWLPPSFNTLDWIARSNWHSDGKVHFCACCARAKEAA